MPVRKINNHPDDLRNVLSLDIDECEENPCDNLTECNNSPGGFSCTPCPSGYEGTGLTGCLGNKKISKIFFN